MSIAYGFLLVAASAVEVQLAWQHDAWRLALMTVALILVFCLRRELTRKP